jgi:type VI secretion system protein ImpF
MNSASRHTLVQPSIIDRLLDDAPDNQHSETLMLFDMQDFRRALARDLEALLNTRLMENPDQDTAYPLAAKTMLRFGVSDLSAINLLNPDHRELLRKRLKDAIETHEPRLTSIKVHLDSPRDTERHLRFKVDAILIIHPQHPPVTFDATLQLSSSAYRVQG